MTSLAPAFSTLGRGLGSMVLAGFGLAVAASMAGASDARPLPFHAWAQTPPMGWNSWDSFATTITEAQTRAQAEVMAKQLKPHGWEYLVVDIQWYEPGATGYDYRTNASLAMDEWGRLQPAPNRFPSAADGAGFKPLADHVHSLGLKFGIHLMRGIPRLAVERNLPVFGSDVRAADIANTASTCPWNPDMYGVDMSRRGAQDYYDSVFGLIASWGVDYVKVDDISRPYHEHEAEIEAIRRAIDKTGRPIVLSLSPGETALTAADHARRHANLWRISDDFWDTWPALHEQFERLRKWNPYRGPGYWPDADMLPFGVLDLGRRSTRFTRDEQFTVMTLWSIARSPLMHGGDMTKMDEFTLSLLTNDEVLAVNQQSKNNRPVFDRDNHIGWMADVPGSADKYLALFNARERVPLKLENAAWHSPVMDRNSAARVVDLDIALEGAARVILVVDDAGDGTSSDNGVWIEPELVDAAGQATRLIDLPWTTASAGWGALSTTKDPGARPIHVDGKQVVHGIGAHAKSIIEYPIPAGAVRLRARAALDDAALKGRDGATVQFMVFRVAKGSVGDGPGLPVSVDWAELGVSGPCRVRDLWTHRDLGVIPDSFAPEIPWHGAGLYRISPAPKK